MVGKTRSEASFQTPSKVVGQQVDRQRLAEAMRFAREKAKSARAPAIVSAPVEIAKRDLGENRDPVSICSSEAIAKQSTDDRTAVHSPELIAKAPAEIRKTITPESDSAVISPAPRIEPAPSREMIRYRASDYHPVLDIERRALEMARREPAIPLGQMIASWRVAIGSALRGSCRDALWSYYERTTDLAWWWRAVIKPTLKFLARFIPGREPEPSRVSKGVEEEFRCLKQPPPPWPPEWRSPRTRRHPRRRERLTSR